MFSNRISRRWGLRNRKHLDHATPHSGVSDFRSFCQTHLSPFEYKSSPRPSATNPKCTGAVGDNVWEMNSRQRCDSPSSDTLSAGRTNVAFVDGSVASDGAQILLIFSKLTQIYLMLMSLATFLYPRMYSPALWRFWTQETRNTSPPSCGIAVSSPCLLTMYFCPRMYTTGLQTLWTQEIRNLSAL
ncbi:hypothetical protein B0H16DRAFT_1008862 [Mycena metata]|uniref:Uncharacterized protein n=1 Tax=Mycena metata TaxID=1033252 RepID=A0AAD7IJH6_9AGAR|nr:hypothetical protein B0H16DRAFT_1008862 [Mycena metata]